MAESTEDRFDAGPLLTRLGLPTEPSRPVIVVCGGADDLVGDALAHVQQVLGAGVARAAEAVGAVIIDGGTDTGVMAVVGAAREYHEAAMPWLVGVAPSGLVTEEDDSDHDLARLEPHHTHFVLANSATWGGETGLMFRIANAIAGRATAAVLLAGGGSISTAETLEAVRRRWPVIVLEGSGGFADELAEAWRRAQRRPTAIADATLHRIVRDGDVRLFNKTESGGLARWLAWALSCDQVLKDGWLTFAGYDRQATALRRSFENFQKTIIILGLLATALGLAYQSFQGPVMRWLAIVAPSVIAATIALANRRGAGKRWVLLRGAAEAVKAEIFRYRTHTASYATGPSNTDSRSQALAARLAIIEAGLMDSEASSGSLEPNKAWPPPDFGGMNDDGISKLDGSGYVAHRVSDQLGYYRRTVRRLDSRRKVLQIASITAVSAGTALAAAGLETWIALTTALSAGAISYLSSLQADALIVSFNQSAAQLDAIRRNWFARLNPDDDPEMLEGLVAQAEEVADLRCEWLDSADGQGRGRPAEAHVPSWGARRRNVERRRAE